MSRASFWSATLCLVGAGTAALALAGCASRRDNPFYSGCTTDDDCEGNDTCRAGFCISPGDAGPMDAPVPMDVPIGTDAPDVGGPDTGPTDTGPTDAGEGADALDAPDPSCPGAGAMCSTSMAGLCADGTTVCVAGGGTRCERDVDPVPELCDLQDNDCDGAVDESTDRACFSGATGGCIENGDGTYTCMGVCAAGIQRCSGGSPGVCEGEVRPSTDPDACTAPGSPAVDDDCDGMIDEDCTCMNGATRPCYAGPAGTDGTGRCVAGTLTCTGGAFGMCVGEVLPRAEACDNPGTDDDCNGTVDDVPGTSEPCDTGMLGVCADGVTTCVGSAIQCVGPTPRAERCDLSDDDCNGIVDNGFDLDTSEDHCGGCGLSCGAGRTCCGGTCVSTSSDPAHCGDCPTTCSGTMSACCGGVCRAPTAGECTGCGTTDCSLTGRTCCNGTCANYMTDSANCGGCGAMNPAFVCDAGERCCAGTCVGDSDAHCGSCSACAADSQCCGPSGSAACVPDSDPMNCRACGVVCGMGQECCSLGCSNLNADVRNCGMCGRECGASEVCSSGICCPSGSYNSGGICCATGTYNSGGICCATGSYNSGGICCLNGRTNCGGTCVNTLTNETHCGGCAPPAGTGETCGALAPRCCNGDCALAISCAD